MRHLRSVSIGRRPQRPAQAWSLLELQQIGTVLVIFAEAFAGFTTAFLAIGEFLGKGADA